jgi:DNA-directed RNA polymerase subunit RPC12/RpoP
MPELELKIRCQRCGEQMEMKDPAPGQPWRPDQFWVCARCGRHFWSTYPNPPAPAPAAGASPPAPEAPKA